MIGKAALTRGIIILALTLMGVTALAEDPASAAAPDREDNPLVLKKLEQWQDARFGLLMHWGTYSQKGWCESWPICSEPWITRGLDDYQEFKRVYEGLQTTFNPVDFDPDRWADLARAAGMRYVVFTTKHHDGFCMFDTEYTDYKITDESCPFHANSRADVTREIFDAFRRRGFMTGAYFSKADWHSPYYWSPYWATPDRHCNYDPEDHPELWEQFKTFTHGQVEELVRDYGPLDLLWFDAAWVAPAPDGEERPGAKKRKDQDLDMDELAAMARSYQPDLIIVDRWVHGRHENYLTPEQKIPEQPLDGPWETCMPMAGAWSYYPDDNYKPVREILRQLSDVVSRGGNYLLNIGVDGQGNLPADAVDRLEGLAAWMAVNAQAIHGTRAVAPYTDGKCRLTRGKAGEVYAIYVSDEGEDHPPTHILLTSQNPVPGTVITLLGVDAPLAWESVGRGILVKIPSQVVANPPVRDAWVLKIGG